MYFQLLHDLKVDFKIVVARFACSSYASCGHFVSALRLQPTSKKSKKPLIFVKLPFYNTCTSYVVNKIIFVIKVPEYNPLKPHFWDNLKFVHFLVVNNDK